MYQSRSQQKTDGTLELYQFEEGVLAKGLITKVCGCRGLQGMLKDLGTETTDLLPS